MRSARRLTLAAIAVLTPACSPSAGNTPPVIDITAGAHLEPDAVSVAQDGQVIWSNDDTIVHRVAIGDRSDSVEILPGDVAVVRFDRPGTWLVHDASSSQPLGVVTVGA